MAISTALHTQRYCICVQLCMCTVHVLYMCLVSCSSSSHLHCLCVLPAISQTPMNQASTRSHCIFTIHVCSREPGSATLRRSKLHLVDLAGSERVGKTGVGGQILTEAKYINLSLHYLEQVRGHANVFLMVSLIMSVKYFQPVEYLIVTSKCKTH